MATKSSISINYTTAAGKKGQKSVTDVNPDATNAVLKEFAGKVNALTTNIYGGTTRVDKTPLKSASQLKTPFLRRNQFGEILVNKIDEDTVPEIVSLADSNNFNNGSFVQVAVDFITDAKPYIKSLPEHVCAVSSNYNSNMPDEFTIFNPENEESDMPEDYGAILFEVYFPSNDPSCLGDIVIAFPETEKYAAGEIKFTVTGGE